MNGAHIWIVDPLKPDSKCLKTVSSQVVSNCYTCKVNLGQIVNASTANLEWFSTAVSAKVM